MPAVSNGGDKKVLHSRDLLQPNRVILNEKVIGRSSRLNIGRMPLDCSDSPVVP